MSSASIRRIGALSGKLNNETAKSTDDIQAPRTQQRAAESPSRSPRLGSFLHAPDTAARDVMRVCNQIKRMASLVVTASQSGHKIEALTARAEELTETVLDVLGYDNTEPQRLDSVRPMIMESVCALMADTAKAGEDPLNENSNIAAALISIARSRGMARAIDRAWPSGVEEAAAVRVAAVNALTPVTLEALSFDFFHPQGELMKESAAILYEVVQQTVVEHAPEAATNASKMVLTQSLLQSAGRVMASIWNVVSEQLIEDLNSLESTERNSKVAAMKAMSTKEVLKPVKEKFGHLFAEMMVASDRMMGGKQNATVQQQQAPSQVTSAAPSAGSAKTKPVTYQRVVLRKPGGMGSK